MDGPEAQDGSSGVHLTSTTATNLSGNNAKPEKHASGHHGGSQTSGNCDNNGQADDDQRQQSSSETTNEQMDTTDYNHQCYICDKIFSANSNLNRHLRKVHKENVQSPYNNVRCALCESLLGSSCMYADHLEKDHKVAIENERLTFQTREAFEEWKHSVESETRAQFIKSRGEKRTKSVNKTYYSCNRSGYYVSKARTQKALKKQGSRKIGGRCPASMNVTINEDSSYEVRFIKTHVGHDFDLKHLDLSEKDRDLIVRKLTSGVTKREIIRQIRSTAELHQNASHATTTTAIDSTKASTGSGSILSAVAGSVISANGGGGGGICQPIVINSRSSLPGRGEQQIEGVVPTMQQETPTRASSDQPKEPLLNSSLKSPAAAASKDTDSGGGSPIATQAVPPTSRLHLATTKDIHNIINSKHLDSKKIRHNYDLNTVDGWLSELEEMEGEHSGGGSGCGDAHQGGPVLLYKDQSSKVDRFPKLQKLDFMLAIMKQGQAELLKELGPKCLVLDSTHHVHCEYLHVTYLSVIDDDNKSLPVAFLFSSRTDLDVLETFFTLIRERVGCISTRMLIADHLHDFYQAWWKVMSMPVHNLLSPWCVFESLTKKFDLVRGREKLRKVKRQLRSLLTETEPDKLTSCLNQMLADYKRDPDTCKFIESFEEQFAKNPDIWSNSFRKSYGVSNYQLWNMHDKFKTAYKEGKNSKKMCKYITCLMGLLDEQQLERLCEIERSNRAAKMRSIELRHKRGIAAGSLVYEVAVEPAYWLCPSECSSEVYDEVRHCSDQQPPPTEPPTTSASSSDGGLDGEAENDNETQQEQQPQEQRQNGLADKTKEAKLGSATSPRRKCCDLACPECQACRHEYKCTCLDYVVGLNMCKHIHRISALCKQG